MGRRSGHITGRFLRFFALVLFLFCQVVVLMISLWEVVVVGTLMLVRSRCGGYAVVFGGLGG